MVSGAQPFRAADTRRLEQRIRARLPPAALDGGCPAGSAGDGRQAARAGRRPTVTAARPHSRRSGAIRVRGIGPAEREGWPDARPDEPATRRTHRAPWTGEGDDEVTRRTVRERPAAAPAAAATAANPLALAAPPRMRRWRARRRPRRSRPQRRDAVARQPARGLRCGGSRAALMAIAIVMVLNEIRIYFIAGALAQNVPAGDHGVTQMWNQHDALRTEPAASASRRSSARWRAQRRRSPSDVRALSRRRAQRCSNGEWRQTRDALALTVGADSSLAAPGGASLLRRAPAANRRRGAPKARSKRPRRSRS